MAFLECLDRLAGLSVYLIPLTNAQGRPLGNNGDELMQRVFNALLHDHGVKVVTEADEADAVLVPPNGALLDIYSFPALLRDRLVALPDPSLPLIIAPSSALFASVSPSYMFNDWVGPIDWFLREGYSSTHLRDKWGASLQQAGVTVYDTEDVVVLGKTLVDAALEAGDMRERRRTLVALRTDNEANRMGSPSRTPRSWKGRTIATVRQGLGDGSFRVAVERTARRSQFRRQQIATLAKLPASVRMDLPEAALIADISAPHLATYLQFSKALREHTHVVTDRLHVALPASILGKQTVLVNSGYHKLRGIYERSMRDFGNVTFIDVQA